MKFSTTMLGAYNAFGPGMRSGLGLLGDFGSMRSFSVLNVVKVCYSRSDGP